MPVNNELATDMWYRYQYLRENGHRHYIDKSIKCEDFFAGLQWDPKDLALLKAQKRPALTINKIIATMSNVMGEQIYNRTDIAYRPRSKGANGDVANALSKVFAQISDNNQLPWVRSDVFADGVITGRGFYDVRLGFSDSMRGEVEISQLNPKNVMIDADADEYDPDHWGDVLITKWMSPDQIELMYSKASADLLRGRQETYFPYAYDALDRDRDRFGGPRTIHYGQGPEMQRGTTRNIRVLDRQWRKLSKIEHFVDIELGDMRPVPLEWDHNQVSEYLANNPNISVIKKLAHRIRWTVIADNVVLHDDWSPYSHFTVVPFFPHFRRGRTMGLVENLLGPQELLNKVSSQELHVVNTVANSGWKVKHNALKNMSTAELEARGAMSGLVLELDEIANAEKINPNQTPTGLDRISFKAEEHIKGISGVSDYMSGFAREDVSAKAVQLNQNKGSANLAKPLDNLNRTDWLLARNILDLVQQYYTEQRLVFITTDRMNNATETMTVNEMTPEGQIANDLTLGEYSAVVTSRPERDMFEESQFEQALRLRVEAGIPIDDKYIIQSSRLQDKNEILADMDQKSQTPEAQEDAQLARRAKLAEVEGVEAENQLKAAKAQAEALKSGAEQDTTSVEMAKMEREFELEARKIEMETQLKREQMEMEMQLKREQMEAEMSIKRETALRDAATKRVMAAQQAARTPTPTGAN